MSTPAAAEPNNGSPSTSRELQPCDFYSLNAGFPRKKAKVKSHETDFRLLQEGTFSDFTVVCGAVQWKAHKVILARCPYFERALSEKTGWVEAMESTIKIEGFEVYEIEWLLEHIYTSSIDVYSSLWELRSESVMETCVTLWHIGDYFCYQPLANDALAALNEHNTGLFFKAGMVHEYIKGIPIMPDLEAGIRAAWRDDRAPGPCRDSLIHLCIGLTPYLRDDKTFLALLDEIPEFSSHLSKALLGCPGENKFPPFPAGRVHCAVCGSIIAMPRENENPGHMYYRPATSLAFLGGRSAWFCSLMCYKTTLGPGLRFPL